MIKEVTMPNKGDLKVWWIPQVPMKSFQVPVKSIEEAKLLLNALAAYDFFQYKMKVKPDYANAGGLMVFEDCGEPKLEWIEWSNEDGETIDDLMKKDEAMPWVREIFSM
jgi:hypothetical protein